MAHVQSRARETDKDGISVTIDMRSRSSLQRKKRKQGSMQFQGAKRRASVYLPSCALKALVSGVLVVPFN